MTSPIPEYFEPWSLAFQRDGTEDVAVIRDFGDEEIAVSRPFWLPKGDDPIPPALSAMRLMNAAPKLLTSLIECVRLLADHADRKGEEVDAYGDAMAVINEATGMNAWPGSTLK